MDAVEDNCDVISAFTLDYECDAASALLDELNATVANVTATFEAGIEALTASVHTTVLDFQATCGDELTLLSSAAADCHALSPNFTCDGCYELLDLIAQLPYSDCAGLAAFEVISASADATKYVCDLQAAVPTPEEVVTLIANQVAMFTDWLNETSQDPAAFATEVLALLVKYVNTTLQSVTYPPSAPPIGDEIAAALENSTCTEDFDQLSVAAADCSADLSCDGCEKALDFAADLASSTCPVLAADQLAPVIAIANAGLSWCELSVLEKRSIAETCASSATRLADASSSCASSNFSCSGCGDLLELATSLDVDPCAVLLEQEFATVVVASSKIASKCSLAPTCGTELNELAQEFASCAVTDGSFCDDCAAAIDAAQNLSPSECASAWPIAYGAAAVLANTTATVCGIREETQETQKEAVQMVQDVYTALGDIASAVNATNSTAAAAAVVELLYVFLPSEAVDTAIQSIRAAITTVVDDLGTGNTLSILVEMTE
jgi:hypothetical protein